MLGRDFAAEEAHPGKDRVVILSNRLRVRSFNSNASVVGMQIRMNGEAYTVVGVLPPGIYDRLNPQLWCHSHWERIRPLGIRVQYR
jgi:putative ABC transport system permease protein